MTNIRFFFFDSLGQRVFPERLKKFLIEGVEITEKTDEGERQIKLEPFCKKQEIDFRGLNNLTGQQMNGSDCGWWAVYYVLMTVYTGGVGFLEPLKKRKLSAKPLRGIMNLQEPADKSPSSPKSLDQPRNESLNDLKKEIEGYLGKSFHFVNIFASSKEIYLGRYGNQDTINVGDKIEERSLKFAVLTNEKDSQNQQIVRCCTISHMEKTPGSRFSKKERVLVENELPNKQSFVFEEYKMFARKGKGGFR